jgi:hypothetical protein
MYPLALMMWLGLKRLAATKIQDANFKTGGCKAERLFGTFAARPKSCSDMNLRSARYVYWVRDTNLKFYCALCSA